MGFSLRLLNIINLSVFKVELGNTCLTVKCQVMFDYIYHVSMSLCMLAMSEAHVE